MDKHTQNTQEMRQQLIESVLEKKKKTETYWHFSVQYTLGPLLLSEVLKCKIWIQVGLILSDCVVFLKLHQN